MKRLISVLLLVSALYASGLERKPMSLIIMIDGMRVDAPDNLNMINYQMLRAGKLLPGYNAVFADNCRTVFDAPPDSAPNHASIMTGVSAAKHQVKANGGTRIEKFKEWKPYLLRLTEAGAIKKGAFYYLWAEDDRYPANDKITFYRNREKNVQLVDKDEDCVNKAAASLESDTTPESTLLFIDALDHAGHRGGRMDHGVRHGFYPYSRNYIYSAARTDWWLGNIFHALRRRKNFNNEDWLIIICSDHGGLSSGHGTVAEVMARTTPLLVVSKNIRKSGTMAAMPSLMDIAPTVLAHHGVDVSKLRLDGKVLDLTLRQVSPRKLSDNLLYYLPFNSTVSQNLAGSAPVTVKNTPPALVPGRFGKAANFKSTGGFLQLVQSDLPAYENKQDFTVTFWIKTTGKNSSDPVIFSNKDWKNGFNPGAAFVRKAMPVINPKTKKKTGMEDFYMFNIGSSINSKARIDMRKMHNSNGNWLFFCITNRNGQLYAAQGFPDGNLYWMCESSKNLQLFTALPWTINQDGTGTYRKRIDFQLDDFAMWTRSMTIDEIKNIFILGRTGADLKKLIEIENQNKGSKK